MEGRCDAGTHAGDLEGKVALIIGGSRNQGAAFAEDIAARGATTVITYANDEAAAQETLLALEKHGVTAEAVRSDARRSADVDALFEGVLARHGKLDIVVHTPGAVLKKPLADFTDADFDHLIDMNTRSAFNTLRATARHIADHGRYVVLSTTLTSVMTGPYGLYSGSKAAVERMVLAGVITSWSKYPACEQGNCDVDMSMTQPPSAETALL
jgi:3-oxoacyl-[acyl-carrier protein] reductase